VIVVVRIELIETFGQMPFAESSLSGLSAEGRRNKTTNDYTLEALPLDKTD